MSAIRFINNCSSVPTYIGTGASGMAGKIMTDHGFTKVMLVCDEGVMKFGLADTALGSLKAANVEVVIFDKVMPDPADTMVEEAAALYKKECCQAVIAVGGGSSIDTGKCVSLLAKNEGPIVSYIKNPMQPIRKGDFLITVPTTSGTGSEVSNGAILTLTDVGVKGGMAGSYLLADVALCDPLLTRTLPKGGTAATAMDAFAHATEAILNGINNPITDALSREAIRLVTENVKRAVDNGREDLDARENLMIAAYYGGMVLSDSPCNYGHAIAHTIGAKYHIPHGMACAIATPLVVEYYADIFPDRVRMVGKAMGVELPEELSNKEAAVKIADAIRALNKSIGIKTMADCGIKYEDLPMIANMTLYDGCVYVMKMGMPGREITVEDFLPALQAEYQR